ncbi:MULTISPECIES: hypothetical protein [Bacillaceae]|uniref:DUF2852 domain-containing protein n=1 Tax=Evansella alkalicola TaxID=745819 RepID=A0ABS6JX85_9BACI|nr:MULTISPECIES: hypothetical protein [Bacillaceae]MBU9723203.1 DUF2852 domain-containing protein [Bacillus alkalicola]
MPFYLQWWAIIIGFIVFWPVGIGLLIWRIAKSRKLMLKAGNLIRIVGIIILVFYALLAIASVADPEAGFEVFIFSTIFFFLPGFILYRYGKKLRLESKKTKQYIQWIINEHLRTVDEIARRGQLNPAQVRTDIHQLMEKNFLPNARLNQETDRVEFIIDEEINNEQDRVENSVQNEVAATTETAFTAPKPRSVSCSGCGANNMVVGDSGECEYCGTALNTA